MSSDKQGHKEFEKSENSLTYIPLKKYTFQRNICRFEKKCYLYGSLGDKALFHYLKADVNSMMS